MRPSKCLRCGSTKLDQGLLPIPFNLHPVNYKSNNQRKLSSSATVEATMCLDCGHLDLYCDPQEVKRRLK
ncbi:hypothetical protein COV20_05300 [Candidatus Woesearchaeota archaeon CG10_big_fil_rev_8_21_14_0_10_45_16]|nr:MAG: hypothetical protein COV20_05300 [Candidatus Woesearchaeota archaeon CG10_big_fil_rev_8_21_14_0_10_45_16]